MSRVISRVGIEIERAVTVAPYTVHKVRVSVDVDINTSKNYKDTLDELRASTSAYVDECVEREKLEYGGNK